MTHEPQPTPALEAAARRRRELREALIAFEGALASPVRDRETWRAEVADALEALGQAFEDHVAATEAPGGLYDEMRETSPHLGAKANRLRDEHPAITAALVEATARLAAPPAGRRRRGGHPRRAPAPDGPDRAPSPARGRPGLGGLRDRHRRHRRRRLTWLAVDGRTGRVRGLDPAAADPLAPLLAGGTRSRSSTAASRPSWRPRGTTSPTGSGRRDSSPTSRRRSSRPTWRTSGPARGSRSRRATRPRSRGSRPAGSDREPRRRCSLAAASTLAAAARERYRAERAPGRPGPAARGSLDRAVRGVPRRRLGVPRPLRPRPAPPSRDFHRERLAAPVGRRAGPPRLRDDPGHRRGARPWPTCSTRRGAAAWLALSCADGGDLRDGTPIEEAAAIADATPGFVAVGVNCTAPRARRGAGRADPRRRRRKPIVVYPELGRGLGRGRRAAGCPRLGPTWTWPAARTWVAAGARLVGGCCRVGPGPDRGAGGGARGLRRRTRAQATAASRSLAPTMARTLRAAARPRATQSGTPTPWNAAPARTISGRSARARSAAATRSRWPTV